MHPYVAAAAGNKSRPLLTRTTGPSRADAAGGQQRLPRPRFRPPTGRARAVVASANRRPESGQAAGERRAEEMGRIRGLGKAGRLEQRKRDTRTISVPQMPSDVAERMKNTTPKFTH